MNLDLQNCEALVSRKTREGTKRMIFNPGRLKRNLEFGDRRQCHEAFFSKLIQVSRSRQDYIPKKQKHADVITELLEAMLCN